MSSKWLKAAMAVLLVVSVTLVSFGCSEEPTPVSDETQGPTGNFIVAQEAEVTSLDPFNSTDGVSSTVQRTMLEGLLDFDKENNVVPLLAEEFYFNEDASAITFKLRQGIKFHDGSELTAEVVKKNFDFVCNKDNNMARRGFFSFIDEVIVEDEYTVTVKAKEPNSAMASYLAHPAAAIKSGLEIDKKLADPEYDLDRNAVGTGPFKFSKWESGQYVEVVAFEDYWNEEGKAKVAKITFKPVTEASTRVNMLKTGEAHYVSPLPTLEADALEADPNIEVFSGPSMNVFYIGLNLQLDKYKDVKVRHALNHAINKDELIARVLDGYGRVADSAIAPTVYGYSKQDVYEYNTEKAKQLLAQAGYPDGFKATLWTRNTTEFIAVAEFVKMQLAEIGIEVEVQPYESGTLFEMLDSGQGTDMYVGRWSPGTGEADWGLRPNFASDRIPPNYNNSGFYINETVDRLLDEALAASDPKVALQKYAEVQKIIYEEAPWVFLYVPDTLAAKRAEVKGITIGANGIRLNGAYFEEK